MHKKTEKEYGEPKAPRTLGPRAQEQAVSPVIAVILMVAITVVLAAVLFVMVGTYTENQKEIAIPLGVAEGSGSATHWILNIISNDHDFNETSSQLQRTGIALAGYNTLERQTSGDPAQVMTWYDNNGDWKVSPGDSILIEKPAGAAGDYDFIMLTSGGKIIEKTLTA